MSFESNDKDKVKSTFESGAQKFDRIYDHSENKSVFNRWLDRSFRQDMYLRFERTLENIGTNEIHSILDVGCGSGRYCIEYLKMGKKVVGIDMASNMLKIAQKSCYEAAPDGEIEFISGNYMEHQFEQKFDAAVLMGLFDYIEDAESMLKKLKTDVNKLVIASFPRSDNLPNKIRKFRYFFKNCPLYFYSREQLERIFLSIGVDNYTIKQTDREYFVKLHLKSTEQV
ncbi:MAG: class I SAM-dependent methyltransferase [Nitrospina sp.]|jgi:ubiquinone/menaquinone biosynthesis C-methylase UbiE|nr:class I SAM-dependent methyltransferase [Nitrospina sp.]MBT3511150.1 class I SAM-dependent methyltransferase [Nitrospina sp.]MBT3876045.1 class I SAM-dependent methyltransferase [Nitrospina sp.]MBT4048353.1 class I SAM-dependent methyltransferase [Nitrospina sp.]MBT4556481.1 class I SAM-dependent methyltransferase [Nitrospina sp.]